MLVRCPSCYVAIGCKDYQLKNIVCADCGYKVFEYYENRGNKNQTKDFVRTEYERLGELYENKNPSKANSNNSSDGDSNSDALFSFLLRAGGVVLIVGFIWGFDVFDPILESTGIDRKLSALGVRDTAEERTTKKLAQLQSLVETNEKMVINDPTAFSESLSNFTEIQEENYEKKMKGSVWQIDGEVYDVEKENIVNGLQTYDIDVTIKTKNFTSLWVSAICFASDDIAKQNIENLSSDTQISLVGKFKSVSSWMGGYVYLGDCTVTEIN